MAQLVVFEDEAFVQFLPLLFWRTLFELRLGRTILLDRVSQWTGQPVTGVWTRDWMTKVAEQRCGAPANRPIRAGTVLINGRWVFTDPPSFPTTPTVGMIGNKVAYVVCDAALAQELSPEVMLDPSRRAEVLREVRDKPKVSGTLLAYPWDIVRGLPQTLADEWQRVDAAIDSELDPRICLTSRDRIHVGERAVIHPTAVLDATEGPVYLSHDVRIGAGAVLEGPLYVGPGSWIHPHTWIHGGNSIGPVCKVGGEITGCVIHGYTNKQHSGFLGHSYVGSWVNLGAGTSNSDLKNTYGHVRVPINGTDVDTGDAFFGAIIGDHVKTGINSSLATGAVLGFSAFAARAGFVPKYVPSFGWVSDTGIHAGKADRMLDTATKVMARRNIDMTDEEIELFLDLGTRVREVEAKA